MTASAPLIVLAAGGTGGHVFPAQALASELTKRGMRAALVTDARGSAHGEGVSEVFRIRAGGLAGKGIGARIRGVAQLGLGTLQAKKLLKQLDPGVVVGFGGYASVPTMLAARFAGFRTAIHEQNAILGRANRLLAGKAARIATSFERVQAVPGTGTEKVVHTGMPVRPTVAAMRDRDYPALDGDGPINLLILGGSQGAHVFSAVVPEAVVQLPEELRVRLHITQQCRPEDLQAASEAYRNMGVSAELSTFFSDVPERLASAHLMIARSGASTVAELLAVGRPAILVPYPYAVDDHQTYNGHAVAEAGAGWLMDQDVFTPDAVAERLRSLFELPATLQRAAQAARDASRIDAAVRLADMVCELLPSNGGAESGRKGA